MIFGSLSMKRNTAPETPYAGYGGLFMIGRPTAGIKVNEEVALTYSAFWGCVRIISETLAMLPWRVFERLPHARGGVSFSIRPEKKRRVVFPTPVGVFLTRSSG